MIAPVLGVAVSVSVGISTLFLAAIPVYLIAGFTSPRAGAPEAAATAAVGAAQPVA